MNTKDKTLAVVFPGQSSQHLGMLSDFATRYKLVRKIFDEVSEILNYDIWRLTQYGPITKLNKTCYAQPAILTASVIIWRVWREQGGQIPNLMAGHSLGEYSALVCSESIDLLSAVKLIMVRSKLMQEVSPYGDGAMSVIIGLNNDTVIEFCKMTESIYNQIVAPAGFNAPGNIVISGHIKAVEKVNLFCKKAGAKYVKFLPISVPSHCIIMKPMVNKFKEALKKVKIYPPKIPIINNTDVSIESEPLAIRDALIRQLYTPVRWHEIIQKIIGNNIEKFLEMGPGKVLTQLIQRSMYDNIFSLSINNINRLLTAINMCVKN
ncbi:malonyl CoA-acyl carrier protein transacylase [Candidatus Blochmanniella vafra str. BVAF]|uniref:Malonyl CoA-acyl carrier protein transacylase n=1 Tax=Blochmanniella vafra (strain BVAF) TaxID=859654 RepID=E8Q6A7_BLOVB|nr:ACP S-malonyltransferase [Candidatus Blochmannia vafer]ADV33801.1 malonyl CoA-acyl carrier protein transacylase [Candidatus Blochmannia vafer str. BVAF]